jgi:hypothetical protein
MSQAISASVSLVIEPLLSLQNSNLESRIFSSAKNVKFFSGSVSPGQYRVMEPGKFFSAGVLHPSPSSPGNHGDAKLGMGETQFLLDKNRFFYLI